MMKSYKLIPDRLACRKDTQCWFKSWVIGILVEEMFANQFAIEVLYGFTCKKDT